MAELFERMSNSLAESMQRNLETQTAMVDAMSEAYIDGLPTEDELVDGMVGSAHATDIWLEAIEQIADEMTQAAEGEGINPEALRDIWLQAANEALSEVMATTAFASATGERVEMVTELRQELDEMTQDNLAQVGFATREDVVEVGERLVELERRQHAIERKLDRVLEEQE